MIEFRIARRYLWAARKQAHTAFLSGISMLGLAVGVATLLISLALLSGLQNQIKARLIASSPALLVEPVAGNTIPDSERVIAAARDLGAKGVAPVVTGIGWGANEEERHGRPMRIRSWTPGEPLTTIVSARTTGPVDNFDEPVIFLSRDYASSIGLDLGERITVVAPRTKLTPFGPVPVWRKFRIARLLQSSSDERAADARIPLDQAESLFATGGNPTSLEVYGETDNADRLQRELGRSFPNLQFKTWKDINRPLFLALRLEKIVMFATISLIIFVAALNLISSLSMLILEKRPQVGVLRTLGATERMILVVFLEVGLLIGIGGTILGNVFGIGLAWAADRYHLIKLPAEMYFIGHLPFALDAADVIGVNIVAVLLSVLATWYPARLASRLDPITAIREE